MIPWVLTRYLHLLSITLVHPTLHWIPCGMKLRRYVPRLEIVICMGRMKMLGVWMLSSLFFVQDCERQLNCN